MRPCVCWVLTCVLLPAGRNDHGPVPECWLHSPSAALCQCCVFSLFAASGLKCFTCWGANPGTCTRVWDCPSQFDRCSSTIGEKITNSFLLNGHVVSCCYGETEEEAKRTRSNPQHQHFVMHFKLFSHVVSVAESMVTKECMRSDMCDRVYSEGVRCCAGDLCNGATHTGAFAPLLLAPAALITLLV